MAAGGSSSLIEIGPGRLYVAALGTTEPASASTALPSAWRAIGYTEEGSAFSTELTQEAIEVAEEIDPVLYKLSRRANTLALSMVEMTRRNLALALGDVSGIGLVQNAAPFEPPDPGSEVACMIVWDSLDDPTASSGTTNIRWLFRQCKSGGTIEIPRRKSPTKSMMAVTFNLEKPAGLAPFKVYPNASYLI